VTTISHRKQSADEIAVSESKQRTHSILPNIADCSFDDAVQVCTVRHDPNGRSRVLHLTRDALLALLLISIVPASVWAQATSEQSAPNACRSRPRRVGYSSPSKA
jgi:hypothetical protein